MRPGPDTQYRVQDEPPGATVRVPEPRPGEETLVPAWPASLIAPTGDELIRWFQLWSAPQAATWARAGQHDAVAALVRLEERCCQARPPTASYVAQLSRLRSELGLCP